MSNNIYSAYHYSCKTKADREAVEQIYEEVKKSAQNALFRNIGDIFFTARTDTEINGAVECNGGTYSTADFEGKQNVGNLLASGSLPYVALSEYESLVSANGSCRAFGWDGGDSFRVPTIPALLLTKEQSAVVGNGMTLGLTNGTTEAGLYAAAIGGVNDRMNNLWASVGSEGTQVSTKPSGNAISSYFGNIGVTTDPDKSGMVANLDVIEYRAMVQLASGATDQAVITATSALQQLANKANSDLSNVASVASSFKEQSVGWGMPDYSAGVDMGAGTTHTATRKGWVMFKASTEPNYGVIQINGIEFSKSSRGTYGTAFDTVQEFIPVDVGDTFFITKNASAVCIFYPCKGVN